MPARAKLLLPAFSLEPGLQAPFTCAGCLTVNSREELLRTLMVCPDCNHHHRLRARERLRFLVDGGSFVEWDAGLTSVDPLGFVDQKPYPARVAESQDKTGEADAFVTGRAAVRGHPIAVGVFDFAFMGGSMGSVVGEKIKRACDRATRERLPVIIVTASGGARMQEGTLALMQMAKATVAIAAFRETRLPYVVLLTDPTTGGVSASVAMQGDVLLAEPGAQVGFAGPRVIEQTIRAPLPRGFQRAERLLEHGQIDDIVPRAEQRARIQQLLVALTRETRWR